VRTRAAAAIAAIALLSSACGSTVQLGGTRQLGGTAAADGLAPAPGLPTAPPVSAPASGTRGGTLPGVGSTAPGGIRPGAAGLPAAQQPSVVSSGGRVIVGYLTQKDVGAAGAAIGLSGIATGDPDNQMRAMTASINARGGFLGHRIELVSHDVSTAQATSNPSQAAADSCADLVEKKAAIVVNAGSNPDLLACFKKHGIISVGSTGITSSSDVYAPGLPGVYAPSAMSIDRYLPALVDRLHAQGFFATWDIRAGGPGAAPVKIGVQAFDTAAGRHYVALLDHALRRYGLKVDQTDLHSTDVGQNASATSAAVLRFRANGVTHVFNANVLFYKDADNQGYKPRYAIDDTIATPALLAQNVGKSQLHGAMGAGYLPVYEVPAPQDVSPAATRCKALMRKAGEDVSQSLTAAYVLHVCDAMSFLEKGFAAGGAVSAVGLQQGLARMGPFESTITYRSTPTPAHHDGAAGIRDFVYRDDCGCFAFVSKSVYPVP
jgi:ABC-type branched-subunit amino acid transport system substrate-binding protein